jgi:hypothetical protein
MALLVRLLSCSNGAATRVPSRVVAVAVAVAVAVTAASDAPVAAAAAAAFVAALSAQAPPTSPPFTATSAEADPSLGVESCILEPCRRWGGDCSDTLAVSDCFSGQ